MVYLDGKIYVLGRKLPVDEQDTVEVFDISTQTWNKGTPMLLSKRSRFGAAVLNGKIYVAGGLGACGILKSVECYDPNTNEWQNVQSMQEPRSDVHLAAVLGKLYAIGDQSKTVEAYSPDTNTWKYVASMKSSIKNFGVAVLPKM